MRYKMVISYDGTFFHGFQRQKELITIQSHIENALTKIFKHQVIIHGAGRTDTSVHAVNQVVHFDSPQMIPLKNLKKIVNKMVFPYIYIKVIELVEENFHSRVSAIKKEYRYYVNLSEYDPLKANYQLFFHRNINIEKIHQAMAYLIGTHDFRGLSKSQQIKNTIRTIYTFELDVQGDILEFRIVGNGFLHNMVRIIIALMLKIGEGKFEPAYVLEVLNTKNRQLVPYVAKACGLYLYDVLY